MSKLRRIQHQDGTFYAWAFECPGCGDVHVVTVAETVSGREIPRWKFNGSLESPTFEPSLRVRGVMPDGKPYVCHSFIRDGQIEFCSDSTHEHAGKKLPLAAVND